MPKKRRKNIKKKIGSWLTNMQGLLDKFDEGSSSGDDSEKQESRKKAKEPKKKPSPPKTSKPSQDNYNPNVVTEEEVAEGKKIVENTRSMLNMYKSMME